MLLLKTVFVFIVLSFQFNLIYSEIEIEQNTSGGLKNIFEEIGFSPLCVSKSLSICEQKEETESLLINEQQDAFKMINELRSKHTEENFPRNCAEILKMGDTKSGIKKIYPYSCCIRKFVNVFCDQETDGGGWTVIQYRNDFQVRENFYRRWTEYKLGFGNLTEEFWLGLNNIHALVSDTLMELRVDLEDYDGTNKFAKYTYFYISDENNKYQLDLGDYSGDAGDALRLQLGQKFSTHDQDNDSTEVEDCASLYKGAWWYNKCHESNLNGFPYKGIHPSFADGINWHFFRGFHYSLRKSKLSLRPKFSYLGIKL